MVLTTSLLLPDIIILICFIPALIGGIRRGFIEQAVALVSVIAGAWLAYRFSSSISDWLKPWLEVSETMLNVISFALIMILAVFLLFLLGRLLTGLVRLMLLGWLDKFLGFVFSLLKAALIIGIAIILFDTVNVKFELVDKSLLEGSMLYEPFKDAAYRIFPYLKELLLKQ